MIHMVSIQLKKCVQTFYTISQRMFDPYTDRKETGQDTPEPGANYLPKHLYLLVHTCNSS